MVEHLHIDPWVQFPLWPTLMLHISREHQLYMVHHRVDNDINVSCWSETLKLADVCKPPICQIISCCGILQSTIRECSHDSAFTMHNVRPTNTISVGLPIHNSPQSMVGVKGYSHHPSSSLRPGIYHGWDSRLQNSTRNKYCICWNPLQNQIYIWPGLR